MTLVELLVVLLIIGVLAAIAIPSFFSQSDKATDAAAKSSARTAAGAIEVYSTDHDGSYAARRPRRCTTSSRRLTRRRSRCPTGTERGADGPLLSRHRDVLDRERLLARARTPRASPPSDAGSPGTQDVPQTDVGADAPRSRVPPGRRSRRGVLDALPSPTGMDRPARLRRAWVRRADDAVHGPRGAGRGDGHRYRRRYRRRAAPCAICAARARSRSRRRASVRPCFATTPTRAPALR